MAQMQQTLRIIVDVAQDVGSPPDCGVDTQTDPAGPLALAGFKVLSQETIVLSPSAVDQPLLFSDVCSLVITSDEPFGLRLASGETLLASLRAFVVQADKSDSGAHSTGVLLTGNTANEAILKVFKVEKV